MGTKCKLRRSLAGKPSLKASVRSNICPKFYMFEGQQQRIMAVVIKASTAHALSLLREVLVPFFVLESTVVGTRVAGRHPRVGHRLNPWMTCFESVLFIFLF